MARVDRRPRRRLPVQQRRAAILTAAQEAFAAGSYDSVSLAGIAEVAGASEALVHRYFATKGDLYAEIVQHAIENLRERQHTADVGVGGADANGWQRVAVSIDTYLDFVSASGEGWTAPLRTPDSGFTPALELRKVARTAFVDVLRDALGLTAADPKDYALHGYLGFVDGACEAWSAAGFPAEQRSSIITMALGALSGALAALDADDD